MKNLYSIIILSLLFISIIFNFHYKKQIQELNLKFVNLQNNIFENKTNIDAIIDKDLEDCIFKNYMTNDMNNCTYKAIEKWDKEILNYTNQINQLLNNDDRLVFKESQIAWENYYKKEQEFQNTILTTKYGDIYTTYVVGNLYNITKQRAVLLKSYLYNLKEE